MNSLINRYIVLSALVVLLCVHLGLVVWTLVRFTQIEHWSPGLRFFGNEMVQRKGLTESAIDNLQEGIWFHLVRVRQDGGLSVRQIAAGSPAERAGLQPGDLVVSVNGTDLRAHPEAYFQMRLRSDPGDSVNLAWLRDGRMFSGTLILEQTDRVQYSVVVNQQELVLDVGAMAWFQRGHFLIFPIVLLCFGTWLGFRRPHNPVAFKCALLFLVTALHTTPAFLPMHAGWPLWVLSLSIGYVILAASLKPYIILHILAVFPIETPIGTWLRKWAWLILAALMVSAVFSFVHFLGLTHGWDNQLVRFVTWTVTPIPVPTLPILMVVGAGVLLLAPRSVTRRQQRTRLHVLEVGLALGLVLAPLWVIARPGTHLASWGFLALEGPALPVLVWLLDRMVYVILKCALPLSFAYAIATHRIFGLRFVFRKNLRFLINTQGIYLVLCFGLFVVLYEAISTWQAGMQFLDLLAASAAAGLLLILIGGWTWVKVPVIRFMDRHLFHDEIESRERLVDFQRRISTYRERDKLLIDTGKELTEVLDLSTAAVYFQIGQQEKFSLLWSGVGNRAEQHIGKETGFFTEAARGIDGILRKMNQDQSLVECATQEFDAGTKESGFELLVVLHGESGRRACIALGAKQSEEPFSSDEREQLLVLASELELALKNIDMSGSLEEQAKGLRRLSQRLINAQESERSRLAKDLHGDTGQSLTALKMKLELTQKELSNVPGYAKEQLKEAVALAGETLEKIRSVAHGLRPPALDTIGLSAALDGLCRDFAQHTQVSVVYNAGDIPIIPNPIDISLYRILQEGLTNSVRHGHATRVEVDLDLDDGEIRLSICDNGTGFDVRSAVQDRENGGVGLMDMRERLESLGGHLDVSSRPGAGTRLVATIPMEKK